MTVSYTHLDGMSVVGIKPHRTVEMGIARTFQNIRLFGNMTALETVLTGMHCRTGSGFLSSFLKTKRQRIEEAVSYTHLDVYKRQS